MRVRRGHVVHSENMHGWWKGTGQLLSMWEAVSGGIVAREQAETIDMCIQRRHGWSVQNNSSEANPQGSRQKREAGVSPPAVDAP